MGHRMQPQSSISLNSSYPIHQAGETNSKSNNSCDGDTTTTTRQHRHSRNHDQNHSHSLSHNHNHNHSNQTKGHSLSEGGSLTMACGLKLSLQSSWTSSPSRTATTLLRGCRKCFASDRKCSMSGRKCFMFGRKYSASGRKCSASGPVSDSGTVAGWNGVLVVSSVPAAADGNRASAKITGPHKTLRLDLFKKKHG